MVSEVTDPDLIRQLEAATGGAQPATTSPSAPPVSAATGKLLDQLSGQTEPYTGSVLPLHIDEKGGYHLAVPGMLQGLFNSSVGAAALPGDAYMGNVRPGADSYTPDTAKRAADFAMLFSPVNPAVRAGDRAIPGEAMAAMQPQRVAPHPAQALKEAGGAGYDAFRNSGLEIGGQATADLANGIQSNLTAEHGIIAETAPKTFALLGKLSAPPEGGFVTPAGYLAARRGLSDIAREGGTEGLAATKAIRGIDELLQNPNAAGVVAGGAAPEAAAKILRDANGNYAAAMRSNNLTGELDRATTGILERAENRAQAANSGRNLDNTIRQKVAAILEKPKEISGYSDAEIEALNKVLQGGPVRNASRYVGNILGGGGGLGQMVTSGIGAAGGAAAGGGMGAAIGAAAPVAAGAVLKSLSNALARRSLSKADEVVRQNSPLYREMMARQPLMNPSIDRNTAILRALGLGGLYGQPQSGGLYGGGT